MKCYKEAFSKKTTKKCCDNIKLMHKKQFEIKLKPIVELGERFYELRSTFCCTGCSMKHSRIGRFLSAWPFFISLRQIF